MDARSPSDLSGAAVVVDVVSDVVCPWCYIGKRHLEAAIARIADDGGPAPMVRWHPYELNPDLPAEGVPRREYLEQKFGGPARAAQIYERVQSAGTQAGLAFDFQRIERQPNTRDAHRLIAWAQHRGDAAPLVERLFRAYFVEGRFVGSASELASLAADVGIDADEARGFLVSDRGRAEVEEAEARARTLGITGVPFFIIDGKYGLSGAQPSEILVRAIRQARHSISASP